MNFRRLVRWVLFWTAAAAFLRFTLVNSDDLRSLAVFFVSGGIWYWLERRKMRELDALIKK
ncbi:MAG: hypothetical protein HY928_06435 [Elusimicrobia bacterium]|nr:hypothetical protein [Elusimicrobiota bacterium]